MMPRQEGGSIAVYQPKSHQTGGSVPIYRPVKQKGGIIGYGHDPSAIMGMPRWAERRGHLINIPIYRPGGQGGGGFLSGVQTRLIRVVEPMRDQVVERGVKALKNVASDAIEGKDLKQALRDEKTRMHVDLKRKKDEYLDKTLGAGLVKKRKKTLNKTVIDSLFN